MAKFSSVNYLGTGGQVMYEFKRIAKLAGWTVPSSSDGLSYSAVADIITTAGQSQGTVGNMSNASAWFVLTEPGGARSWCLQRSSASGVANDTGWRNKLAIASNTFTGGTPGVTRVPSATKEQIMCGSGTDASPGFTAQFTANSTYRAHIVFDSTPAGGVYPFSMICTAITSGGLVSGTLVQEPMAPGSYPAEDVDPAIYVDDNTGLPGFNTSVSRWWWAFGTANEAWCSAGQTFGVPTGFSNGTQPTDITTGKDINMRILYSGTGAAASRVKGFGTRIAAKGPARVYPATANSSTDAYVYLGNYVFPYENNTVPQL